MKLVLNYTGNDSNGYVSEDGSVTLRRETCKTPTGFKIDNLWVLRKNGEYVDYSRYRNDIADKHNITLIGFVG